MSTYSGVNVCCLNSVLNVKALVCDFNQEKALFGAFSVIMNLRMDLRFKLYRDHDVRSGEYTTQFGD